MAKDQSNELRQPAEIFYAEELDALIKAEKHPVPAGWRMSPRSVLTYICGGKCGKMDITPKYIGHQRLVEIAISTLVTDRALLLIGEPGTAKSWLSEHLAAAINGDSTKGVQGTAGTTEEQIRYTWNYAMLIARGPSNESLIKSPIFRELRAGQTLDGKNKVETPSGVLSTAEAISLLANSMALSGNFGDGTVSDNDLASGLQGAVIKDDDKDLINRKSTRLNSSHGYISYAVFCLKKKN